MVQLGGRRRSWRWAAPAKRTSGKCNAMRGTITSRGPDGPGEHRRGPAPGGRLPAREPHACRSGTVAPRHTRRIRSVLQPFARPVTRVFASAYAPATDGCRRLPWARSSHFLPPYRQSFRIQELHCPSEERGIMAAPSLITARRFSAPHAAPPSGAVREGVRVARRYLSPSGHRVRPPPPRPHERRGGAGPLLPRGRHPARHGRNGAGPGADRSGADRRGTIPRPSPARPAAGPSSGRTS